MSAFSIINDIRKFNSHINNKLEILMSQHEEMFLALKSFETFCKNFDGFDLSSLGAQMEFSKVIEQSRKAIKKVSEE